jgi:hypothetical protein
VIETEGAAFCPHHLRLAQDYGEDLVRKGAVPKRRARLVVGETAVPILTTATESTATAEVAPTNILIAECPNCGVRSHVEASIPEVLARLAAIEQLLLSLRP